MLKEAQLASRLEHPTQLGQSTDARAGHGSPWREAIMPWRTRAQRPRGLGLAFAFPSGEQWRTAMLNLPVFLDNSPQGFYDRLIASKISPDTGKPDPQATARFLAAHPETVRAMALIKADPPTSGFGNSTFRGLNAFYFVNDRVLGPRFAGSATSGNAARHGGW